jgi:hypothetical protein
LPAERDSSDLPRISRSPSGRIPQWVLDEALGKKVEPAPWRGPVSPIQPAWQKSARPRRLRTLSGLLLILAVSAGGTLAVNYFRLQPGPVVNGTIPGAPVNGDGPPPGYEESASPLGAPPQVPDLPEGDGYQFLATVTATASPVTWSPCRPVHYVVREANQPVNGSELLQQALAMTSGATGLPFVSDGTTAEGPSRERQSYQPDLYGKRWAPVLIAWATPAEVTDFAGDVAGEAGPARITTSGGDDTYVSGTVYLDPAKFSSAFANFGPQLARALILHELGHLVGLAHVADQNAIMFPRLDPAVTRYSLGDQVGLAALGRGPCEPNV